MIIFKDVITGDELFSDSFKYKETEDGFFYEVEGKSVTRVSGFDDALIGANASEEEPTESTDSSAVSGVDICLNHNLTKVYYSKKEYTIHIKEYVKLLKAHLVKNRADRVETFVAAAPIQVKKILGNIANYEFFRGELMNPDSMLGLLDFRSDGITPFMLFFKDGVEAEKF